jgi:hypothetical protein
VSSSALRLFSSCVQTTPGSMRSSSKRLSRRLLSLQQDDMATLMQLCDVSHADAGKLTAAFTAIQEGTESCAQEIAALLECVLPGSTSVLPMTFQHTNASRELVTIIVYLSACASGGRAHRNTSQSTPLLRDVTMTSCAHPTVQPCCRAAGLEIPAYDVARLVASGSASEGKFSLPDLLKLCQKHVHKEPATLSETLAALRDADPSTHAFQQACKYLQHSTGYFAALRPEAARQVAARATLRDCDPGELICQQGNRADSMLVVLQGEALVYMRGRPQVAAPEDKAHKAPGAKSGEPSNSKAAQLSHVTTVST